LARVTAFAQRVEVISFDSRTRDEGASGGDAGPAADGSSALAGALAAIDTTAASVAVARSTGLNP
jgi:hypothetical protein